jgi:hypothetical protein
MRSDRFFTIPTAMAVLGIFAHLLVGWMDERRLAFRIVGPLSPFVGWWWVLTLIVALVFLVKQGKVSRQLVLVTLTAAAGIAAVWWYPGH